MKYPVTISVIMPCYNTGKFVSEAIESILDQSFCDFEFIIINDGSSDDTHDRIIKYTDKRIKYIRLDHNKGNYHARNIGIRLALGKYICVMDSDDVAYSNRFELQYNYMEKNRHIGAIGGQALWMHEDGSCNGVVSTKPVCSYAQLKIVFLKNNFIIHPTFCIRNCLIKKHHLSYQKNVVASADYGFVANALAFFPIKNMNDILIKYRIHKNQISISQKELQMDSADEIRLGLLQKFGVSLPTSNVQVFQKIMRMDNILHDKELNKAVEVFNLLLEANRRSKIYNQQLLYNFFDYMLHETKIKMYPVKHTD